MKMTPVVSSNIAAIGYDLTCTELVVQFKNGKTFYYLEVSPGEHAALMASESVGKHFNQFIKAVKVGNEVAIAVTDDINTDDELVAEVDAAYEKVNNGTAVFTSNAEVNKMMEEKKSIFKSVADENFKNMKLAIQQCGVKDKIIAEQVEDIDLLREKMTLIARMASMSPSDKAILSVAREALEATKGGE